jgi:hypothetical protein
MLQNENIITYLLRMTKPGHLGTPGTNINCQIYIMLMKKPKYYNKKRLNLKIIDKEWCPGHYKLILKI